MGLLDDAIREHLDLKRRHGADPTEVEQAEREALGPVRRDPFEQSDDELEQSAETAPAYDQDEEPYEDERYEPADERHVPEGDWDEAFEAEHAAEEPEAEHPAGAGEATQILPPEEFDEDEAAAYEDPAVPPPHPAGAGAETVEYDVEEAFEAKPRHAHEEGPAPVHDGEPQEPAPQEGAHQPGAEEDVLEETPEFLQDTPDHDRLWFEQRPPKDFDFDG